MFHSPLLVLDPGVTTGSLSFVGVERRVQADSTDAGSDGRWNGGHVAVRNWCESGSTAVAMELPAVIDLASMVTNGLVAARSALHTTRAG